MRWTELMWKVATNTSWLTIKRANSIQFELCILDFTFFFSLSQYNTILLFYFLPTWLWYEPILWKRAQIVFTHTERTKAIQKIPLAQDKSTHHLGEIKDPTLGKTKIKNQMSSTGFVSKTSASQVPSTEQTKHHHWSQKSNWPNFKTQNTK